MNLIVRSKLMAMAALLFHFAGSVRSAFHKPFD
jgi:hypothetical protein